MGYPRPQEGYRPHPPRPYPPRQYNYPRQQQQGPPPPGPPRQPGPPEADLAAAEEAGDEAWNPAAQRQRSPIGGRRRSVDSDQGDRPQAGYPARRQSPYRARGAGDSSRAPGAASRPSGGRRRQETGLQPMQDEDDTVDRRQLDSRHALKPDEPFALIDPRGRERVRDLQQFRYSPQHEEMDKQYSLTRLWNPNAHFNMGLPSMEPVASPQETLDGMKQQLMAAADIKSEEEWQEVSAGALEGFDADLTKMQNFYHCRPAERDEAKLQAMVAEGVPQDHVMWTHVQNSLQMVQANPGWKYKQKEAFLQRLIRDTQTGQDMQLFDLTSSV
ncbi:hypothetical protein WJX73_002028 [Symbiochloris irregularis]|uniref:Uncharacterized protein n=1 Tax=Symbiochloris irregularis TaxID=706552 RepID=A0AAW1PK21_9CHLO